MASLKCKTLKVKKKYCDNKNNYCVIICIYNFKNYTQLEYHYVLLEYIFF